ncbi:hypothetical protein F2Q69_00007161 [Brassica cretica]|uniref:DUF1985 domain-containing protein n=1 Tax=Brassica cretica TaxID=69181 RepID=A0A8S9P526_BRACR|nr:hypothetical protein F2Q69_00007161 [Brassica cretica]
MGSSIHSTVQRPMADLAIGQLEEAESSSKLPPKLLAWGCYPTKLRLNIYSKAHVIGTIASYHQGSKDMEIIMGSQFGRLFELSVARCHNSAKLINSFLCRQLLTVRKYELWFHFATHPLRFSLDEFHQVTGLNCGVPILKQWTTQVQLYFSGGDTSFAPVRDEKENAGKSVRKVAQPNDQPVHRRNLRPRKPAVVIIEDISSSEDIEPEAPPQPDRCTHEDLKPWMNSSSNSWLVPSRNI